MNMDVGGDNARDGRKTDGIRPLRHDALAFLHAIEHLHEIAIANAKL